MRNYPWNSLLGYVDDIRRNGTIDYARIFESYGGDNTEGRRLYWETICKDISTGIDIKEEVTGGSILGSETFIKWVRDRFLPAKSREIPAVQRLKKYTTKEAIIAALCKETKKSFDEIKKERGIIRQMAMDLFYRVGGLNGTEIGKMMGVDYSTVSQGKKRLRERLKDDKHLSQMIQRVEAALSTIKICPLFSFLPVHCFILSFLYIPFSFLCEWNSFHLVWVFINHVVSVWFPAPPTVLLK
ncbi:MAG: hypothetical protein L3J18_14385 [Candidatus Brocadia sp.]|nr:MAG: hypothetical protein L3J18_14385 [Candidatus Brocadia sp.]